MTTTHDGRRNAAFAGIFFGIGLGGFIDGILLHQILQWHNMLSTYLPPTTMPAMKVNMFWDGMFHLFAWIMTAAGVAYLWRAGKGSPGTLSGRWFLGMFLIGWGLFNLVEGVVDHHLLDIHHVHGAPNALWDYGFLLVGGIGFMALGWWLSKSARPAASSPASVERPGSSGTGMFPGRRRAA